MSTSWERSGLLEGWVMGHRFPLGLRTILYDRRLVDDLVTDFGQTTVHAQIEATAWCILVPGLFVFRETKRTDSTTRQGPSGEWMVGKQRQRA